VATSGAIRTVTRQVWVSSCSPGPVRTDTIRFIVLDMGASDLPAKFAAPGNGDADHDHGELIGSVGHQDAQQL
jgi:hypothetical protein